MAYDYDTERQRIRLETGLRNIRVSDPLPNILDLAAQVGSYHRGWQGTYCIGPGQIQMKILEDELAYQCQFCGTAWRFRME